MSTSLPYQSHSENSRVAAIEAEASAATLRALVLRALLEAGIRGMTDGEMQIKLFMNPSTQRPRRIELVNLGMVTDAGSALTVKN